MIKDTENDQLELYLKKYSYMRPLTNETSRQLDKKQPCGKSKMRLFCFQFVFKLIKKFFYQRKLGHRKLILFTE